MCNLTFSPPGNNWVVNKWGRLSVLRLLQLGGYQGPPYREDVCCVYMRGGTIRWKQINVTPSNIPHLREREKEREKERERNTGSKKIKLMYTTCWIIYLFFYNEISTISNRKKEILKCLPIRSFKAQFPSGH